MKARSLAQLMLGAGAALAAALATAQAQSDLAKAFAPAGTLRVGVLAAAAVLRAKGLEPRWLIRSPAGAERLPGTASRISLRSMRATGVARGS